ncbi:MAG: hypothetical protein HY738_05125 [Bacteroidia bacterium]|nr:hypothetical protein [Bacteroidia bacterium]
MKRTIVLLSTLVMLVQVNAQQATSGNFDYTVQFFPTGQVKNNGDTLYSIRFSFNKNQLTNYDFINIYIKGIENGEIILHKKLPIKKNNTVPAGWIHEEIADQLVLTIKSIPVVNIDFEAVLEDKNGNKSDKGNWNFH